MSSCVECPRVFMFAYGDPGLGEINLGEGLRVAAETHQAEVEAGTFPFDVPKFRPGVDQSMALQISRASNLATWMRTFPGTLHYLSIFSHMGAGGYFAPEIEERHAFGYTMRRTGLLFLGEDAAPDTNMGLVTQVTFIPNDADSRLDLEERGQEFMDDYVLAGLNKNNTPPGILPSEAFYDHPKTQIRLFGCNGAVGTDGDAREYSIAEAIAEATGRPTYGYSNAGGSMMTDDQILGHGKRSATDADRSKRRFSPNGQLWFVPFMGKVNFKRFSP